MTATTSNAMALFLTGGLLFLGALIVHWVYLRVCQRVARATVDDRDGLTQREFWLNLLQLKTRGKLRQYARAEDRPALRDDARLALQMEAAYYVLGVMGMVLMAWGAANFR